ncbi:MAG: peptidylprolyl isomerase [Spirochaetales bacterium]|nr:peptidylprolyl isomerase [Spirochaetales bacterium]
MIITKNKVVTIQYTVKNNAGKIIKSTKNGGLSYTHGKGSLVPGLEKELENKKPGDTFSLRITPEEGYGIYDNSKVFSVSKEKFKDVKELKIGMKFRVKTQQGEETILVKKIIGDRITVDMNHPLAGETLFYDVSVMKIKDSTE